eukprot:GILK01006955.1.p1 GENE.GILK01006955.1~~GILK01006955.1.p1  ORF type:complete len:432 (-),score=51.68 GILK01006955.1:1002-2297(-)
MSSCTVTSFNRGNHQLTTDPVIESPARFGLVVNAAGTHLSRTNPFLKEDVNMDSKLEPRYIQHPTATLKGLVPIPHELDLPVIGVGFIFKEKGCDNWLALVEYMHADWAAKGTYYDGKISEGIRTDTKSCHVEFKSLLPGFYWPLHVIRHMSHRSRDPAGTSQAQVEWLKRIKFLEAVFSNPDTVPQAGPELTAFNQKLNPLLASDSLLSVRLFPKQARVVARDTSGSNIDLTKSEKLKVWDNVEDAEDADTTWQLVAYDTRVALVGDSLRDADPVQGKGAADAGVLALALAKHIALVEGKVDFSGVAANYMRDTTDGKDDLDDEQSLIKSFADTTRDELNAIVKDVFQSADRSQTPEKLVLTSISALELARVCPDLPAETVNIATAENSKQIRAAYFLSYYDPLTAIAKHKQICDKFREDLNPPKEKETG